MKHTPGPWKSALAFIANEPNRYVITTGKWGSHNIAQVYDESNARLIAAAPELLEDLKACAEFIRGTHESNLALSLLKTICLQRVEDTIAKAEGKK